MCYYVLTHTLDCDVRPIMCDGRVPMIDPFAEAIHCECARNGRIQKYLQCDTHGCCVLTAKYWYCLKRNGGCTGIQNYHRYVQRRLDPEEEPWSELPTFDDGVYAMSPELISNPPVESEECRAPVESQLALATRTLLLTHGRNMATNMKSISVIINDITECRLRDQIATRVLNEWENKDNQEEIEVLEVRLQFLRALKEQQQVCFSTTQQSYDLCRELERREALMAERKAQMEAKCRSDLGVTDYDSFQPSDEYAQPADGQVVTHLRPHSEPLQTVHEGVESRSFDSKRARAQMRRAILIPHFLKLL